jgi:uncharacterized repeat protein (TIGR02059 family)
MKTKRFFTLAPALVLTLLFSNTGLAHALTEFATASGGAITVQSAYSWTSHGPSDGVSQDSWGSVTFADGKFVAVGVTGSNRVMTSVDGAHWTAQTAPVQQWTAVTSGLVDGKNRFVAVAQTNTGEKPVMTSDDGVNWTLRDAPSSGWWSITYGNGLFVVVNESVDGAHALMTSPDGITWTPRTPPAGDGKAWASVTYGVGSDGVGRFVAVKSSSSSGGEPRVMYSADGQTWSYGAGAPLNGWYSVTHGVGSDGVGRFVAVAFSGSDRIMTSTDGISWSVVSDSASKTLGASDFWYAVGFGGGKFVAATFGSNKVMTSNDGLVWTAGTAFAGIWRSVAYGNDTFVVVADGGAGPRVERFGPVLPTAPTQLSADPSTDSVTISFTPGLANGAAITNYEYSIDGGLTYIALDPPDGLSPITITGLIEGTDYVVYLRAVNSFGAGDDSVALNFTTLTPPPPPATSAPDLVASSDTGASDSDDITSDKTPTISVSDALDGYTVTVTATRDGFDAVSCSFVATAASTCDLGELADGAWSVTSSQQLATGPSSDPSQPLVLTIDTTAPTALSLEIAADGTQLTVAFSESLASNSLSPGDFAVTVDGVVVPASAISVSGTTVLVVLATPVTAGQSVQLVYTDPTSGGVPPSAGLQDQAGNVVSAFTLSDSLPSLSQVQDPDGSSSNLESGEQANEDPASPALEEGEQDPAQDLEQESNSGAQPGVRAQEPLAATGFDSHPLAIFALLLMLVGGLLISRGRRLS